jgi:hypothetical protein
MALNDAATVTLCSRRKASHFSIMLLLVSGAADHAMILRSRSAVVQPTKVRCGARYLQLVRAKSLRCLDFQRDGLGDAGCRPEARSASHP